MSWNKIGGPAHSLAIFADRLVALAPNQQVVYLRDPSTGNWNQIGGPAAALIGGGWDLYAVAPGAGDLWRYDGKTWSKTGGPGAQFVAICNAVYALSPDSKTLLRFDRYSGQWTKIGGPAQAIIGGGSKVYASAPGNTAISEYSRYRGEWTTIGGAGSMWVGVGGTVYGLAPDKSAVYRYEGTPGSWSRVGGPATSLIGGGSFLYAIQPGSGKLWRYSGTGEQWVEAGTPGAGFVAVDRRIYAMTTDKSEVYEFDQDNTESARLRKLLYGVANRPEFGDRVTRGFLVKQLNGEVLADHGADGCFQPLSTLKLLPYLHTFIEVDTKKASLAGTKVSWVEKTNGTAEEQAYASCLAAGSPGTKAGSAKLADALPTMMWESHNRTLDAVMNLYGPANISARAQQLGLTQTEMYAGCPQAGGPERPWANNISTLKEVARMFEGVDALKFVKSAATRTAFANNLIVLNAAPGTSYTSPITGRKTGPLTNDFLRPIVEREAGKGKAAVVGDFLKQVTVCGKGGGGGPHNDEVGASNFHQLTLPFKQNGKIVLRKFVVGFFVCQMRDIADSAEKADELLRQSFWFELHTLPIRLALASW